MASAASQRAALALNAMKVIGFPMKTAKPVLKNLLRVYDYNWEYIEAENYRVLADAILDLDESKVEDSKRDTNDDDLHNKKKQVVVDDEPELYRKRLRVRQEEQRPSSTVPNSSVHAETPMKRPKLEAGVSPERAGHISPRADCRETRPATIVHQTSPIQGNADSSLLRTYRRDKRAMHERTESIIRLKEPKVEPGIELRPEDDVPNCYNVPIRPNDKPCDDNFPQFEIPIAIICPPHPIPARNESPQDEIRRDDSSIGNCSNFQATAPKPVAAECVERNEKESVPDARCENGARCELASSSNIEIASSALGEVKLAFTCDSAALDRPDFHMPSLETILKMVEDRCLKSYKILDPTFSLRNLMKEMCQCVLEMGYESTEDTQENIVKVTPALESLKRSGMQNILGGILGRSSNASLNFAAPQVPEHMAMNGLRHGIQSNQKVQGNKENRNSKKKESECPEVPKADSRSMVVVQQPQLAFGDVRPLHDVNDISKGEERVRISLVNEVSSDQCPPSFYYIPRNIVYQNAYVNFSLSRIGDEDCCADCFGDCLAVSISCSCARETGGDFAYTLDGLLKKEFLDECISMNLNPQKHRLLYCKHCPLERSKNEVMPEPCKGHLVRKFVKECWSKCGCNKQCGNRVVQRGITYNLQVFFTAEGKGWGLRTLDELPRGAFVCEYVGEVLTNMELYDRTIQTMGNPKHSYPILLDADWGSGVLKDEQALCLDATFYGNVARFINHRCSDANLVEVPVEVESPDHHYYHLAFFTTRKIEAFEELTWDYGIYFDDRDHPIKAFRCHCGSKFCRDKNSTRTRSAKAIVLR